MIIPNRFIEIEKHIREAGYKDADKNSSEVTLIYNFYSYSVGDSEASEIIEDGMILYKDYIFLVIIPGFSVDVFDLSKGITLLASPNFDYEYHVDRINVAIKIFDKRKSNTL